MSLSSWRSSRAPCCMYSCGGRSGDTKSVQRARTPARPNTAAFPSRSKLCLQWRFPVDWLEWLRLMKCSAIAIATTKASRLNTGLPESLLRCSAAIIRLEFFWRRCFSERSRVEDCSSTSLLRKYPRILCLFCKRWSFFLWRRRRCSGGDSEKIRRRHDMGDLFKFSILFSTIRLATPLLLAALGGLISERSGVINIALEGLMLAGAFTGAVVTHFAGNPWIGLLAGMGAGVFIALIHA